MKRLKDGQLNEKEIVKILTEDKELAVYPVCQVCLNIIINIVTDNFDNARINIQRMGKGEHLYYATFIIGDDIEEGV